MGIVVTRTHYLEDPGIQWPDATNTGVPSGTELTSPEVDGEGNFNTSSDGQIVDAIEVIGGSIVINHNNVTVKRSRVIADVNPFGFTFYIANNKTGIVIEDCEAHGNGRVGLLSSEGGSVTYRRMNIHHVPDGFAVDDNVLIEACYIHSLYGVGAETPHNDGFQLSPTTSNITIRGCNFDLITPPELESDPEQGASAGIYLSQAGDLNLQDILVENNRVVVGDSGLAPGAYTFRLPLTDHSTHNIVVQNNVLGAGLLGYIDKPVDCVTTWAGNVDYITGDPVA